MGIILFLDYMGTLNSKRFYTFLIKGFPLLYFGFYLYYVDPNFADFNSWTLLQAHRLFIIPLRLRTHLQEGLFLIPDVSQFIYTLLLSYIEEGFKLFDLPVIVNILFLDK